MYASTASLSFLGSNRQSPVPSKEASMTRVALHARLIVAVVALIPATAARSQPSEAARAGMTQLDGLKQVYLDCERRAAKGDLETSEIMKCSVIYEELKRCAFGGDFKLLKAWAETQVAADGS
jgi:hypothetical protein